MPLYRISEKTVTQIKQTAYPKERDLQRLFEDNLETLLGVRFLGSEITTGDRQRGRIDTLGLDQDKSPTIIEYKRSSKENIINQGVFYMDWLVDHKGDFTLIAQSKLGANVEVDWSHPRLILVAESFSDYDKYAVNRIGANIELWSFRKYGDDLFFLDLLYSATPQPRKGATVQTQAEPGAIQVNETAEEVILYTLEDHTKRKSQDIIDLFESLREGIFSLAEDGEISEKANKMYVGYKHGKNFCEIRLLSKAIIVWLDISTKELDDPRQMVRDVSSIGHYGTGDSEIRVSSNDDISPALYLIEQSYRQTL